MSFPIAVALNPQVSVEELERVLQHQLDTVIVPIDQDNWKKVVELMTVSHERGWGIEFFLWAKGLRVKNVPLHKLANYPCLSGWIIQDISDPALIAMLRATTESGNVWSWQKQIPFTGGVLSTQPSVRWWAWIQVGKAENLAKPLVQALLSRADGVCFSRFPTEDNLDESELSKAIGFWAVHLKLWKPLLAGRSALREAWEWKSDEAAGWIWSLENGEFLLLFVPLIPSPTLPLSLPFVVQEGVRAYAVQFPALTRLPLQRKGDKTLVKSCNLKPVNLIWLTNNMERVQKMHHFTNELLPKAMQFAVQWVLARRERLTKEPQPLPPIDSQVWSVLQKAKRRQLSHGYTEACKILSVLGAFPAYLLTQGET